MAPLASHPFRQLLLTATAVGVAMAAASSLLLPGSYASHTPKGRVDEPRLTGHNVSPALNTTFTFKGWVDFPGSKGTVEIDVLNDGNVDASNESGWRLRKAVATPSNTPTVVSGQNRYYWSVGPIQIFTSSTAGNYRWPEGGVARVRFRAVYNHSNGTKSIVYLPVRDSDGKEGVTRQLVLTDYEPTPTRPVDDPRTPGNEAAKTPNYLNRKEPPSPDKEAQKAETESYYRSVLTSETGTEGPSIADGLPTLLAFIDRYFRPVPSDPNSDCDELSIPETIAKYFNKGDLGLGREMHCTQNWCSKETACYVKNFGKRDGTPVFDNKAESFEALKANKPFATVAMVERGKMGEGVPNRDAPNKVFFVVYGHNQDGSTHLLKEAPLDNKAYNTFIPGNCLVCHGTASSYSSSAQGSPHVNGAYFLPFDLQAFEYYSSDSTNALSRAKQELSFNRLNKLVYFSDLWFLPSAGELINGWYGGHGLNSTFTNDFVPSGWNQNDNTRQLYKKVVAKTCRTCHISDANPALAFNTYTDFSNFKGLVYDSVCKSHRMPNSEQSLKVFWRSSARSHLLNRLELPGGCWYPTP
jgi:hypothetical protein